MQPESTGNSSFGIWYMFAGSSSEEMLMMLQVPSITHDASIQPNDTTILQWERVGIFLHGGWNHDRINPGLLLPTLPDQVPNSESGVNGWRWKWVSESAVRSWNVTYVLAATDPRHLEMPCTMWNLLESSCTAGQHNVCTCTMVTGSSDWHFHLK